MPNCSSIRPRALLLASTMIGRLALPQSAARTSAGGHPTWTPGLVLRFFGKIVDLVSYDSEQSSFLAAYPDVCRQHGA
jgi:hypothetical protein